MPNAGKGGSGANGKNHNDGSPVRNGSKGSCETDKS